MQESIIIRQANPADAPAITAVYLASRKQLLAYAPLRHSDASVLDWIRDILIPNDHVSVAEVSGRIVGMMALSKSDNIGWIDQLYVLPEAVQQGIGTMFVSIAKTTLGSPIRLHTFQENIKARRFYERHGFQVIALSNGATNEERCPDVTYEWRSS